jgi:hypothetical protein
MKADRRVTLISFIHIMVRQAHHDIGYCEMKLRDRYCQRNFYFQRTVQFLFFGTIPFVTIAQPNSIKKDNRAAILSISYFIESANNSINSLNGLLKKDNYRNKITTLNNPANSDLGFNLQAEINIALEPILKKAKKTDHKKFKDVIENFLNTPDENGLGVVKKYLPAASVFSCILSVVGSLVITEKNVTREDLDQFTKKIQLYFVQYERLNEINEQFSLQIENLLNKSEEIKEDLKEFLADCIYTMNRSTEKEKLIEKPVEFLVQKYYDPQKIQNWLDKASYSDGGIFPTDAATSVKFLTSSIKKLQREFEEIYNENFRQLNALIASLKTNINNLDQKQLDKTNQEITSLYNDSKQADLINMNIAQVDERMNTVCRIINMGK